MRISVTGLLTMMCGLSIAVLGASARADLHITMDRRAFHAQTLAQPEPEFPNLGLIGGPGVRVTVGSLTFEALGPSFELFIGTANVHGVGPDWTSLVAGHDVALSGPEHVGVDLSREVTAAGFYFAEQTRPSEPGMFDPCTGCPCQDSTFEVTVSRGGVVVGRGTFNAPDDESSFVGLRSDEPFDRVTIRETTNACDNEYFGQWFLSPGCYPDCDTSTGVGILDIFDFLCFQNSFAASEPFACDCDTSTGPGVCDIFDFLCFQNAFANGCP